MIKYSKYNKTISNIIDLIVILLKLDSYIFKIKVPAAFM